MLWKKSALDVARTFGYLSENEVHALQGSISEYSDRSPVIVNIGAGLGTSTLAMREICNTATIYSVDVTKKSVEGGLENERRTFKQAGYAEYQYPIPVHMDSVKAGESWNKGKTIDILFIDANHEREGIMGDINAWLFHVKHNGLVVLHDYGSNDWPHVKSVADYVLKQQVVINHVETIKVYRKTSHVPFETLIPTAPVDINKLPYVIDALTAYTDTIGIHVVTPNPSEGTYPKAVRVPITIHSDDEVLKFDRTRFKHRPNWVAQQFIKLFQNVTMTDFYLVIDADLLFNHPVEFFKQDQPIFMFGHNQDHDPYFVYNQKMIGIGKTYPYSFLSECTLYSKRMIREMLTTNGYENAGQFVEKSAECIDGAAYPAESELYGSWMVANHPDMYEYRKLKAALGGKYWSQAWTNEEIEKRMKEIKPQDADIFTIHTWEGGV